MPRAASPQHERLLEAAIHVFADRGLAGATTRLVGRAAGVNGALLYYYFEDKETLFVETLRRVVGGLLDLLRQRRRPFRGARERLGCLVDAVFDYYSAHPERMRLMSVAASLHADLLARVIRDLLRGEPPLPLALLEEGMEQGTLKMVSAVQVWWNILGMCAFSLQMQGVLDHLEGPAAARLPGAATSRQQILDLLVNGLATRRADGPRHR